MGVRSFPKASRISIRKNQSGGLEPNLLAPLRFLFHNPDDFSGAGISIFFAKATRTSDALRCLSNCGRKPTALERRKLAGDGNR
jgi:hypothetical protein